MTKIQIDDGKSAKTEVDSTPAKKAVRKIVITEAPKEEKKVEKKAEKKIEIVEKKTEVVEKKTEKKIEHQASHPVNSTATHSILQKSTTLSRRYVKKPTSATPVKEEKKAEPAKAEKKPKVEIKARIAKKRTDRLAEKRLKAEREQAARAARIAKARAEKEAKLARKQTALKARTEAAAAKKAAKIAKKVPKTDRALRSASTVVAKMAEPEPAKKEMKQAFKKKRKAGRVFLALICSGATVAALVAFVHFSIPDLSVRVAAIQTGIEATYPTFVPRNYNLGSVTSDKDGVILMHFDGPEGASFTLSEEKSTWDSTALLNNYVKKTYPSDFTTLREQGITIYVRGEKASWVNGGLLYKIESTGKYLTKEQIRNIATSL